MTVNSSMRVYTIYLDHLYLQMPLSTAPRHPPTLPITVYCSNISCSCWLDLVVATAAVSA